MGVSADAAGVPSATIVHTVYPPGVPGQAGHVARHDRGGGRAGRRLPPFGPGVRTVGGLAGRVRDAALARVLERSFAPGLKPLNEARAEYGLPPLRAAFGALRGAPRTLVLTVPEFDDASGRFLPEVAGRRGAYILKTP